jgi:hypothetical protein
LPRQGLGLPCEAPLGRLQFFTARRKVLGLMPRLRIKRRSLLPPSPAFLGKLCQFLCMLFDAGLEFGLNRVLKKAVIAAS